jgi:hypothetical protein
MLETKGFVLLGMEVTLPLPEVMTLPAGVLLMRLACVVVEFVLPPLVMKGAADEVVGAVVEAVWDRLAFVSEATPSTALRHHTRKRFFMARSP